MVDKNKLRRRLALTASIAIMGTSVPFNVLAESVYNDQNDKNIIINNTNDNKEIINNDSGDKLELNSDVEKESVKAEEDIKPEAKFDKDMNIDDPATYDYAGYVMKHYNPTNEKFMKEQNRSMFFIEDTLKDNTDKKNEKIVFQSTVIEKGKDLSEKLDEYILELEKNKGNNKIDVDDIKNKVFGENPGFVMDGYFDPYLNCLYSIYNSTYQGDGDGHKLILDGKLFAGDFTVENFKEIYKNNGEGVTGNGVIFTINNSFRNKPIIWSSQVFLSEEQYFQYRDEIMDFIKSEAGFKNLTSRKTRIVAREYVNADINSQKLPNNIKNALSEEYVEENMRSGFDIVYDTENINKDPNSYSKEVLKKAFDEGDFSTDKDVVNDESFSLRIGFDLNRNNKNDLPANYYLSKNDKLIFKGSDKLAFKEKSKIIGSEYYISNTITDKDDFVQRLTKYLLESAKDDEDFNKLTKKEQDEEIQSQIQENLPYIDEAHKDDSANIKKYQDFLNSKKWGNQRLTQYVGNVDTKTEEQDFKIIKKEDPTLAFGESKVAKKGVKGKKVTKTTYKVNRTSGELTDPVSEIVEDTTPVDEVILVGTKKVESKPETGKDTKPEEKPETEKLPDKEIKVVGGNISIDHLNLDRYLYSESPYKHGRKQIEKVRFDIDDNKYVERKALPIRTDINTHKSEYPYYIFTIGDMTYIKVTEKGREPRKMDVKPYLKNERTMLPLRYVGEALNADVTWDNNSRTAYFTRDGITARIQIDGNKIELSNGKVFTMDTRPDNINGRIFVPITNVSQVFTLTNGNATDEIKQNIEWSQQDYTTTVYPNR